MRRRATDVKHQSSGQQGGEKKEKEGKRLVRCACLCVGKTDGVQMAVSTAPGNTPTSFNSTAHAW